MRIPYNGFFYNTDKEVWEDPQGDWLPEEVALERMCEIRPNPPKRLAFLRVGEKLIHLNLIHYMERQEDGIAIYTSDFTVRIDKRDANTYRALLMYMVNEVKGEQVLGTRVSNRREE
jgi:hypothetical protein